MSLATRKLAFVFPGQGSQKVGMVKAWADASPQARATFAEADEALGFPLSRLCWEGPEEELNLTANTQPALVAASIAVLRALAAMAPELRPVVVAGHSLGEYSALVAAGALDFADALRLVRRRGELMQEAVPVGQGAMAAIIGLDPDAIAGIAADASVSGEKPEVCAVANLNGPAQTVIAGDKGAVDRAVVLAKERGARKATLLAVSAPFHSPLMRPAREGMAPLLAAATFRDPLVPVVTNVDAAPVTTAGAARDALVRQIDSPVRWVESVLRIEGDFGVQTFVEVGPGSVLSGLTRRIVQSARATAITDPDHLRRLLAEEEG
ncbi:MAG TPA: ACP S-malonyltransferase [Thermoanaerobaculia bacterium]|jgi:[acyl-carrier-protein] S-malonyltransferase